MLDPEGKIRALRERLPEFFALLDPCRLCPRECRTRRQHGEKGECGATHELRVSSVGLHHGEEFPISGHLGSGTIFLTGCNLHCRFCQNWTTSQAHEGEPMSVGRLADAMIHLQRAGAHNINWVTPTHVVPLLMNALLLALEQGLEIPIVYNSGGYESLDVLRLLDGLIDIYMPDMKYGDADTARQLSDIDDYPRHNQAAIKEMYDQVGPLVCDDQGIAVRGLLIRHLVLPENLASSEKVFAFLEADLPGIVHVNVMDQYHPCFHAAEVPALRRRLLSSEYESALKSAREKAKIRILE